VLIVCSDLSAAVSARATGLEEQSAHHQQPECLPESDGLQPKQFRHQPVPQPHQWEGCENSDEQHGNEQDEHDEKSLPNDIAHDFSPFVGALVFLTALLLL